MLTAGNGQSESLGNNIAANISRELFSMSSLPMQELKFSRDIPIF